MRYETQFVDLQVQQTAVVCGQVTTAELPEFLGSAFGEVITVLDKQGLIPTGAPFGRYRPTEKLALEVFNDSCRIRNAAPAPDPAAPTAHEH